MDQDARDTRHVSASGLLHHYTTNGFIHPYWQGMHEGSKFWMFTRMLGERDRQCYPRPFLTGFILRFAFKRRCVCDYLWIWTRSPAIERPAPSAVRSKCLRCGGRKGGISGLYFAAARTAAASLGGSSGEWWRSQKEGRIMDISCCRGMRRKYGTSHV
jgi:hypothetical protein